MRVWLAVLVRQVVLEGRGGVRRMAVGPCQLRRQHSVARIQRCGETEGEPELRMSKRSQTVESGLVTSANVFEGVVHEEVA
ncbi:hypothetical protein BCE75_103182 [Isoptericola sp. CG 20/1183]|uniref:Secreted protein n=1 Tax=Isoptericola halotolerans TaxID=300560 RepID=A0ABX5EJ50_9MICO|nr:hypothetical protein BCL65_103183 [Isoptericola halotolerans]PRZ09052.1 hypothetical protein BCE75_103182 [Isoptericola sp. CG 20/1183]